MSELVRTKAIVLRRTNYGEADRIVQLITPTGRYAALVKGVRREKSKLAGGVELFCLCDVVLRKGKGELYSVTSARADTLWHDILHDYDKLQFAYEALKQVAKASETLEDQAFFELLSQTLAALNSQSVDIRISKAWFWLQLAILIGAGLNITSDSTGKKLVEDAKYDFDIGQGVFAVAPNGRFGSDHIKLLRLLSAQPPQVAQQVKGIDELIGDCVWLAEHAVAH